MKSGGKGGAPNGPFTTGKPRQAAGNNNTGGAKAVSEAMSFRSASKPARVVPAPTMANTLGPGSRK